MLMHAGIDFATAEKMPMHYALAFLSERQALIQIGAPKPMYERQHNTYTPQQPVQPKGRATTSTNTYNSTKRVCS